jgi:glycosyltransferase involved in cell wall biosynthesis
MKKKVRVLFLQSVTQGRSIEDVHSMVARHFTRNNVEIHVACDSYINGEKTPTYKMFEAIPDAHIRPTNFGQPVLNGSQLNIARNILFTGLALSGSLLGLIGYIKRHHIDIVHTADRRDVLCGVLLARLTDARCIVHLHQNCGAWMNPASLWALRRADGIIGVSQFTAQSALTVGCRPERIYHVLNGVDLSRWNCDADGSTVRQEFSIASDVPTFAIIARVVPSKGYETLLYALSNIKGKIPDFRLLVVGKDDPGSLLKGNRSYLAFLKEKVDELGLSNQIIFTGYRSDIQNILAASDLYTMPALDEAFGLVFSEAMAMKKPVIALDSGGAREAVEDGKSGLLSAPGDTQQLTENILTLVNNPALRWQMGEYGRKRVEEYFNPQRLANDVESVYHAVLGDAIEPLARTIPEVETVF